MKPNELSPDRLAWAMVAFGLAFYAALGTVVVLYAVAQ